MYIKIKINKTTSKKNIMMVGIVCMHITAAFGRLRQEGQKFRASLGYIIKIYLKKRTYVYMYVYDIFVGILDSL